MNPRERMMKTDKKGTQEVTPGKEPTEPASTAGGQTPSAQKNATTSGGQEPVGGIPAAPSDTPSETPQHHQIRRQKLRQHHQRHRQKLRQRHRQNRRQRKQSQQIHVRIRFGQ